MVDWVRVGLRVRVKRVMGKDCVLWTIMRLRIRVESLVERVK